MRGRRAFVARHDGLCPECGDEIDERNERATFPL